MSDQPLPPTGATPDSLAPGIRDQPSWLDNPGHRTWLSNGFADVLTFALPSILPSGGFAYQAADGSPMPGGGRSSSSPRGWPTPPPSGCGTASRARVSCSTTRWRRSSASTLTASTAAGSASRAP